MCVCVCVCVVFGVGELAPKLKKMNFQAGLKPQIEVQVFFTPQRRKRRFTFISPIKIIQRSVRGKVDLSALNIYLNLYLYLRGWGTITEEIALKKGYWGVLAAGSVASKRSLQMQLPYARKIHS